MFYILIHNKFVHEHLVFVLIKSVYITLLLLFSVHNIGNAQEIIVPVSTGIDYSGKKISYIAPENLRQTTINEQYLLKQIISRQSIDQLVQLLGKPLSIELEQDKANDGTILFERKIVNYPGFRLIFPKKGNSYALSRVDFTSNKTVLKIDSLTLSTGKPNRNITSFFEKKTTRNNKQILSIHLAKGDQNDSLYKTKSGQIKTRPEFIKIRMDSNKNIQSISILMYTI
ncbi:MAG: hypothetical protein FH748_16885 [Balneolaceae bacterium]|nr:hypothetical protein [Balneolaceae bacterium]